MALVCGLTTFRLALLSAPSVVGVTNSADITGCVANRAVLAVITGCVSRDHWLCWQTLQRLTL